MKLVLEDVLKHVESYIAELQPGLDIQIGSSFAHSEIGLYTDRGVAFPIRLTGNKEPWTFRGHTDRFKNEREYARFCVDTLVDKALCEKIKPLPNDDIILASFKPDNDSKVPRERYIDYVRYMFASNQTCTQCQVGIVDVDVDSYREYHSCQNCDWSKYVS